MNDETEHGREETNILVIDDDPKSLGIISDILGEGHYSVLVAEDGESGLNRAMLARPDLILLDVLMPGTDGFETCRLLKTQEFTSDIPVIFMTALSETVSKLRGFRVGGVDYITKPFDREEVLARVSVHLHIRELAKKLTEAKESLEKRVEDRTAELAETNRKLLEEIAERKQAEEVLGKREIQLRQAQKMEAVGSLAGSMAHDFNNILTGILGFGNIMRSKMEEGHPLRHYLDHIITASENAARLTHNLLAFSSRQPIMIQLENINEIIRGIESSLADITGEKIELKTELSDEKLFIMADSGQIEQVLVSLAMNSRDAMPDGGILTITTDSIEISNNREESMPPSGSYAVITVSDTGTGMDEETKSRIFEPFFSTKEGEKGKGLGLAICYSIIRQHEGFITVDSKPGEGAVFRIFLKLMKSPSAEQPESVSQPLPEGGKEVILVAEDDEAARKFIKYALEDFGYEIIEAANGEEAFAGFMKNRDRIRLVILDVIMPKGDGRIICDRIREVGSDVRVLFISGYTGDIISRKGIKEADADFIPKPISLQALLRKVRNTLDR